MEGNLYAKINRLEKKTRQITIFKLAGNSNCFWLTGSWPVGTADCADGAGFWLNRAIIESLDMVCFCAAASVCPLSADPFPVWTISKSSKKFVWLFPFPPFWFPFVFDPSSGLGVVIVLFGFCAPTKSSNSELLSPFPPPEISQKNH